MLLNIDTHELNTEAHCEEIETELAQRRSVARPFSRVRCEVNEGTFRISLRDCSRRVQRQVKRLVSNHEAVENKCVSYDGEYLVFQLRDISKANTLLNNISKLTSSPTALSFQRTKKERVAIRRRRVSKGREAAKDYFRHKHLKSLTT